MERAIPVLAGCLARRAGHGIRPTLADKPQRSVSRQQSAQMAARLAVNTVGPQFAGSADES